MNSRKKIFLKQWIGRRYFFACWPKLGFNQISISRKEFILLNLIFVLLFIYRRNFKACRLVNCRISIPSLIINNIWIELKLKPTIIKVDCYTKIFNAILKPIFILSLSFFWLQIMKSCVFLKLQMFNCKILIFFVGEKGILQ